MVLTSCCPRFPRGRPGEPTQVCAIPLGRPAKRIATWVSGRTTLRRRQQLLTCYDWMSASALLPHQHTAPESVCCQRNPTVNPLTSTRQHDEHPGNLGDDRATPHGWPGRHEVNANQRCPTASSAPLCRTCPTASSAPLCRTCPTPSSAPCLATAALAAPAPSKSVIAAPTAIAFIL